MSWIDRLMARRPGRARHARDPGASPPGGASPGSAEGEPSDDGIADLLARARVLPREIEPDRDLWPAIAARLSERSARPEAATDVSAAPAPPSLPSWERLLPRVPVWAQVAAAAALLIAVTASTTLWLSAGAGVSSQAEASRIADTLRGRDGVSEVHESLLAILEARRDEIPAEVLSAIEENLRTIDRAIAEIHLAMERHPDTHSLNLLLAETYRREADLLEQLQWWSQSPGETHHDRT